MKSMAWVGEPFAPGRNFPLEAFASWRPFFKPPPLSWEAWGVSRLRNWWRKQKRNPYYGDMRLIALEHRHLYRDRFRKACCGEALGLLRLAWDRGHFVSQRPSRQEGWI